MDDDSFSFTLTAPLIAAANISKLDFCPCGYYLRVAIKWRSYDSFISNKNAKICLEIGLFFVFFFATCERRDLNSLMYLIFFSFFHSGN